MAGPTQCEATPQSGQTRPGFTPTRIGDYGGEAPKRIPIKVGAWKATWGAAAAEPTWPSLLELSLMGVREVTFFVSFRVDEIQVQDQQY